MTETDAYTFRPATAADLETIVAMLADDPLGAIREQAGDADLIPYRDAFAAIENDPNNWVFVAVRDGAVVGCLQLTLIPGLSRSAVTRAQIESVRVAASERGRGLGRRMFQWTIEHARQQGAGLVQLTTDKSRADALRFYEDLGFTASHEGMKLDLD